MAAQLMALYARLLALDPSYQPLALKSPVSPGCNR
jgi:hypothetical protein